ncbi:OmpA family protein [Mesorhizobium sp. B2-3-14]|nr:OmpA family protein [Mesorhizobium sp. B2-4-18]TPL74243.1 OmpA family protein [Mesorhizobium sp. B2-3-15]TPL81326.1 OmpA family protein [Mesorhizobium sp. B2-3-14]
MRVGWTLFVKSRIRQSTKRVNVRGTIMNMRYLRYFAVFSMASVLGGGTAYTQNQITYGQAVQGLVQSGKAAGKVGIDTAAIRADIQTRINTNASGPEPMMAAFAKLPHFIVQIQFDLNSDVIRPESWVTMGRIADALHNPLLLGNRFVIAGNTDNTGSRLRNLDLSQRRADAVAEMLVTVFHVEQVRLLPLGQGEENPFDPNNPADGVNRRVELFNIGPK